MSFKGVFDEKQRLIAEIADIYKNKKRPDRLRSGREFAVSYGALFVKLDYLTVAGVLAVGGQNYFPYTVGDNPAAARVLDGQDVALDGCVYRRILEGKVGVDQLAID